MTRAIHVLLASLLFFGSASALAQAPQGDDYDRAELSEEGFVAVQDDVVHRDTGMPYVFAAYGIFWVLILGYVVRLGRLHGQVSSELNDLRRDMQDVADRLDELDT